ncbi:hydroxyethylthiazole kinase-like uncharacterized protein yjeF [Sphingobium sp. OAS761]|uniref:NAD(P)H-hydrate dehydratase n=1 Tax=Sphingobium sp. OAS761 TaxID=2817901 RepID=UPI00209D036C|nr:NAD(P)H-hydrate dehydratase [Sphingobium sp. OAS761]MCP1471013.1 hydroxyethylthiazole kinase-like uncharacterized protein yjeF [Sphingobium sp. OAS761]
MNGGEPIVTAAQMRAAEQAVFASGAAEYDVMERAGEAATEIIWRAGHRRDALVLCGPGNNGGDGFVVARRLRDRGVPVRVAALGESRTPSGARARNAWDGPVEDIMMAAPGSQLVDALFGTGLTRGLSDELSHRLCALAQGAALSHAIDLPSGVDTDTGALLSAIPVFGTCIALGAWKPAHFLHPAAAWIVRPVLADIGVPVDSEVRRLPSPRLNAPVANAHKYSRGLVAVLGGEMDGAAALAATAAARSGAGMVRLVGGTGREVLPHAVVRQQDQDLGDPRIAVVLAGPGLGLAQAGKDRLSGAIRAGHPLVLDADALSLLAGTGDFPARAILTPHEGEFRRLFGDLPGSKLDRALAAARRSGAVIVYKGPDSVIAAPDGRVTVSAGASHWLSTAGTGDVLAGIIAARMAVTGDRFRAACEGVWLHGEAARRAGPGLIADDLPDALRAVIASRS